MDISKASAVHNSGEEEQEQEQPQNASMRFHNSLQELRDLSSQLHYAADYSESLFSHPTEKKTAVENTKEYICRAVVALVDHLGCVSINLNHSISQTNHFSEAELRIDALKQRLALCEEYTQKLALNRVRWNANLPKFHRRYLSTQITGFGKLEEETIRDPKSPASLKVIYKHGFEAEDLPVIFYTYPQNPSLSRQHSSKSNSPSVPVRDGVSILSKASNSTFHFQQNSEKHRRHKLFRKSLNSHDFLSLVRRIKRTT
ncbi:hypothetical protein M5689_023296 [Euphorbia peplus]|nr:hypothetical protein M5689_023296 [Euphorbia peplus]